MRRILLLLFVFVLLVLGAGPWIWTTFISPPKPLDLEPMNYAADSSWSALPVIEPPAVWEDGWGIDVFVILESSALEATSASRLERKEQTARAIAASVKQKFQQIGSVYVPLLRSAAVNDDTERAFDTYLRMRNKGRALLVVSDTEIPGPIVERIGRSPALKERFGGFVSIQGDPNSPLNAVISADGSAACGGYSLSGESCGLALPVDEDRTGYVFPGPTDEGFSRVLGFAEYLNSSVAPMAEPLGDFEEVEIIDIRRPGETDD